ncbi:MAG: TPM domain-containing protein, partial [Myxococcales bacterium]|nr:TPM domain-containing protein [Myxococcales bacterium]
MGYGLEGAIPDAIAKRVISDTVAPYFKRNDYSGGIFAGFDVLMRAAEGEAIGAPTPTSDRQRPTGRCSLCKCPHVRHRRADLLRKVPRVPHPSVRAGDVWTPGRALGG